MSSSCLRLFRRHCLFSVHIYDISFFWLINKIISPGRYSCFRINQLTAKYKQHSIKSHFTNSNISLFLYVLYKIEHVYESNMSEKPDVSPSKKKHWCMRVTERNMFLFQMYYITYFLNPKSLTQNEYNFTKYIDLLEKYCIHI